MTSRPLQPRKKPASGVAFPNISRASAAMWAFVPGGRAVLPLSHCTGEGSLFSSAVFCEGLLKVELIRKCLFATSSAPLQLAA